MVAALAADGSVVAGRAASAVLPFIIFPRVVVVSLRRAQVCFPDATFKELAEATKQVRSAQPQEARDQLGDGGAKGGGNAEHKGQPNG